MKVKPGLDKGKALNIDERTWTVRALGSSSVSESDALNLKGAADRLLDTEEVLLCGPDGPATPWSGVEDAA